MAYVLNQISIRTNNSGDGMKAVEQLWADVASGKLPVMFDSEKNFQNDISVVAKYSNYESNENGDYDFSILGVTNKFFEEIEQNVIKGTYKKYDESDENGDVGSCTLRVWQKVWNEHKNGIIDRAFTVDYESSIPAQYSKDQKAHCCLYIAVK